MKELGQITIDRSHLPNIKHGQNMKFMISGGPNLKPSSLPKLIASESILDRISFTFLQFYKGTLILYPVHVCQYQ